MDWIGDHMEWVLGSLFAVAVLVCVAALVVDCNRRGECRDRGGRVVTLYDQCTRWMQCDKIGNSTICSERKSCPWVCEVGK